jgi:anti-anti-sigma regulatory factor
VLRITVQNTAGNLLLTLEGRVKGPWVEELRKCWLTSANMAAGEPVSVDLSAVNFVDAAGLDLLLQMQKEGLALKGASGFLRQMLGERDGNANGFKKDRTPK